MSKATQENRGPAFDAAGSSSGVNVVEHEISAKSGTKALTPEQRHKAQIKRSGAGHEKQQAVTSHEKDRLARYADACKRNGQKPDLSELKQSGEKGSKPSYLLAD